MKQSTKAFREWFKTSELYGVWFPHGVSQMTFTKYVKKSFEAGYQKALKDMEEK